VQESDEAHDFSGFILIAEKGPQPSSLWKCGNPRVRTMLQEHVTVLIHAKVYFDRSPYSDRTAVRTATGIAVLKVYDPTAPRPGSHGAYCNRKQGSVQLRRPTV
jgi:hypothetical protein